MKQTRIGGGSLAILIEQAERSLWHEATVRCVHCSGRCRSNSGHSARGAIASIGGKWADPRPRSRDKYSRSSVATNSKSGAHKILRLPWRACVATKSGDPWLKGLADALYVCIDALMIAHRIQINTLALGARLPTMHGFRDYVEAGGLMSYGPNYPDLFRRAADYADKILRGAKPGELPVEQPTKFDFVLNLTTAKALGLTVPPTVHALADEVIE